ncbi:protein jag [Bacillaceae bacterium]
MTKVTVAGRTVEEAVQAALAMLNTTKEKVTVRVLQEPSKGFFGLIGAREAKVEVEKIVDPIEEACAFLRSVFASMRLDVRIDVLPGRDELVFYLSGKGLGLIIGRRGRTLDALQYLTNVVANRCAERRVHIVLDAENYRSRRVKALEELADRLAEKVVRTKKSMMLEPMSALERKIIHTRLQGRTDVATASVGEEPNRRVVISLR